MPIYEYGCEKCGNEVDVLQKIGDPAPAKCEKCGAKGKMKRRVSRTSFVLKGGGWGADLYGNKKSGGDSSSKTSTSAASTTTSSPTPAASTSTSTSTSTTSTSTSTSPSTTTPAKK